MQWLYKNWTVHHLLGHPLMQIFTLLRLSKLGNSIHDATLPAHEQRVIETLQ